MPALYRGGLEPSSHLNPQRARLTVDNTVSRPRRFRMFVILTWMSLARATHAGYLPPSLNPLVFKEVERVSRDHEVNAYRGGALTLVRHWRVDRTNVIGIDAEGAAHQIVSTPARTLGFLLSGSRAIVDLFVEIGEVLYAVDDHGRLLRFDLRVWLRGEPAPGVRTFVRGGAGGSVGGLSLSLIAGVPPLDAITLGLATGVAGGLGALLTQAARFSERNDLTDGMVDTGAHVMTYRGARPEVSDDGLIDDWSLVARPDVRLSVLRERTGPAPAGWFDATCETWLARGLPY